VLDHTWYGTRRARFTFTTFLYVHWYPALHRQCSLDDAPPVEYVLSGHRNRLPGSGQYQPTQQVSWHGVDSLVLSLYVPAGHTSGVTVPAGQ
jgi:hypothetical protein